MEELSLKPKTDMIQNMIYIIRNQQVMLDSDLAMLYQVETKALNRAVKRNIKRFPKDFCFQLTAEEYEVLKCQIGTSKMTGQEKTDGRGGRRTLPYVFTEQGISMLASVLHSEIAINVSIGIMRAFVEMRHFMANNAMLFERISSVELKQLEYQKQTDEKIERIFDYISEHKENEQKIFFDGQIYDAFSLLVGLIKKAEKDILLIDNYVDIDTLNILTKKNKGVKVLLYTSKHTPLSKQDINKFNKQYPYIELKFLSEMHDRFLILDHKTMYHIGASLKDAGKKCFAVSLIKEKKIMNELLQWINGAGK